MFLTLSSILGLRAFESVHMEPIQVEGGKQRLLTDPESEAESRSEAEPTKPQTLPLPAGQASPSLGSPLRHQCQEKLGKVYGSTWTHQSNTHQNPHP